MKNFLLKIKDKFSSLLFPQSIHCICCGSEIFNNEKFCLCESCLEKLTFLNSNNTCKICGTLVSGNGNLCERCVKNTFKNFTLARAVLNYDGIIIGVVHNLKFNNKQYLAKPLSNLLFDYFIHSDEFLGTDVIIPVPLHKNRLKERGYNQTELLLQSFQDTNFVCTDCVSKIVETDSQRTKNAKERFENMKNCFQVDHPELIKNKNVVIFDDVFTTGATCSSLAKTLLKSGAKQVKCLTLCNTIKHDEFINKENEN